MLGHNSLICCVGSLNNSATATLLITGTVAHKATQMVNQATVSASELDSGPAANYVHAHTLSPGRPTWR